MIEFIRMIQDDIVDKEQLVLKRFRFLNIDKIQAQYIAKLFSNKELKYYDLSLEDICNELSIPKQAGETLVKGLVKDGIILIQSKDGNITFNFEPLINKLIESYITPNDSETTDVKLDWAVKTLKFELTPKNIEELKLFIDENGWTNLSIVINKISTIENPSYSQLISMYETIGARETTDSQQLKELMDLNWLEN